MRMTSCWSTTMLCRLESSDPQIPDTEQSGDPDCDVLTIFSLLPLTGFDCLLIMTCCTWHILTMSPPCSTILKISICLCCYTSGWKFNIDTPTRSSNGNIASDAMVTPMCFYDDQLMLPPFCQESQDLCTPSPPCIMSTAHVPAPWNSWSNHDRDT